MILQGEQMPDNDYMQEKYYLLFYGIIPAFLFYAIFYFQIEMYGLYNWIVFFYGFLYVPFSCSFLKGRATSKILGFLYVLHSYVVHALSWIIVLHFITRYFGVSVTSGSASMFFVVALIASLFVISLSRVSKYKEV